MASKLLSTDQQNFTRLGMGCVDLIKLVLKDILKIHIQPKDLYTAINSCSELTTGICRLRPEQRSISFISPPFVPDYEDFDVSLLYTLIRNLCLNLKPTQGWGKTPTTTEIQIGDDIERLRLFRNGMFAHLKSTAIPDTEFSLRCNDLQNILLRTQAFVISKGYSANYVKELTFIEKSEFGFRDMEKYRILLEGVMHLLERSENEEIPKISINGQDKVLCGEMVLFEAEVEHSSKSASRPIIWQKRRKNGTEQIDTTAEKYEGSTSRRLVIKRVSKEDEGEYQALISWVSGGQTHSTTSNSILLNALGERANLEKLDVRTGTEGITLLYQYRVSENSPKVEHITWKKNGEILKIDQKKYLGGSLMDRYLTITSPTCEDAGTYTCIVANAVGDVSESLALDLPNATISTENSVVFGNETRIDSMIISCPACESVIWQKSLDSFTFETIDVGVPKYYGTKLDPNNPVLVLRKVSFDDKRYYRLLTTNKIGECSSNTAFINVTGGPPNISICAVTNIKNRSVSLICEIFLSENSPALKEIVWMKDGDLIEIAGSGGKYTGGTISDASLVINDVNEFDAGSYQCKASNALGRTSGDEIVLSVPEIKVQGPEKRENGTFVFTATTYSSPAVFAVHWSKKNKDNDDYTSIDVNKEEYRGTSNSLPHPVLVIKQGPLHNHSFKIEAQNFIGMSRKQIPDDSPCPNENLENNKVNRLAAIFKKRGSSIRFNNLRLYLIRNIPEEELYSLKESLKVITSMELSTENIKTVKEFFTFLLDEGIFKERNVIMMQYILRSIERPDLELKCVEYARKDKRALCYFEETKMPGDVYKHVQLHIADDIEQFTDIDSLLSTVAAIVDCDQSCITLVGVRHVSSFIIVVAMKEEYVRTLIQKGALGLTGLLKYHVDWIRIENKVIYIAQDDMEKTDEIETGYIKALQKKFDSLDAGKKSTVQETEEKLQSQTTIPSPEEMRTRIEMINNIFIHVQKLLCSREFQPHILELSKYFPNYMDELQTRRMDLNKKDLCIIIAGEKNGGKSTLVNRLVRRELFKPSIGGTIATICRIRNSNDPNNTSCKIVGRDEQTIEERRFELGQDEDIMEYLAEFFDKNTQNADIDHVDVSLYFPLLKDHTMIVDTPWIGGNLELSDKMMKYLPNAVSFIFVSSAKNAGKLQNDRLVKIIQEMMRLHEKKDTTCFDPRDALFVSNKWDAVDQSEREEAWNAVQRDLKKHWPVLTADNIFRTNLKSAKDTEKLFDTEYERFEDRFSEVVEKSQCARQIKHLNFLKTMLEAIEENVKVRLNVTSLYLETYRMTMTDLRLDGGELRKKMEKTLEDLSNPISALLHRSRTLFVELDSKEGKQKILNPPGKPKIVSVHVSEVEDRVQRENINIPYRMDDGKDCQ